MKQASAGQNHISSEIPQYEPQTWSKGGLASRQTCLPELLIKQQLPNLTCRTSPSSSDRRETACKQECMSLWSQSCIARNLIACWQNKQSANTPSKPQKAHHQELVTVPDLELARAMEMVLALETERAKDLGLGLAMNRSLDTVSCCCPCRCCLNQSHKS